MRDARVFGGDLDLVVGKSLDAVHGQDVCSREGPVNRPDAIGDVDTLGAKSGSLKVPGSSLREATVVSIGRRNLHALNVLMNVDGGGRATHAFRFSSYGCDSGYSGSTDDWIAQGVPGAGAGHSGIGNRQRGVIVGDKVNGGEDALPRGIAGGGAKILSFSEFERDIAAGIQGNGLDAGASGITGAFSDTTGEVGKRDDSQYKNEAGTATIHEPSSRPFPGRERSVWRKAASVEGHREFEQVHGASSVVDNAVATPSFEMQPRVVDDVQVSCYYQKVPRVKSGLPVYGGLIGWAVCAGIRLRENLG